MGHVDEDDLLPIYQGGGALPGGSHSQIFITILFYFFLNAKSHI